MGIFAGPDLSENGLVLLLDAANTKSILSAVEVLVVAGGGGGGGWGGGGGGGGVIYSSAVSITPGSAITATVGDGGSAGTTNYTSGGDGSNSVFGTLTAVGGGGGGHYPGVSGRTGGSGGGGGGNDIAGTFLGGLGTSEQGFSGGTSNSRNDGNYWGAGGGGGASEVGKNAVDLQGGNGGNGLSFNISGTSQFYAGGGGGHTPNAPGTAITTVGGLGGGGAGGRYYQSITAVSGTSNTGGGGGGGYAGAAGGSGIVIVRYPGAQRATGGTVTSVGGYTIHTFTTSGTFTPTWGDLTLNGNTGTLTNGPTYSSANGGSIAFDGSNDVIKLTGTESFNFGSVDFTIECWVYFNVFNVNHLFVSKYLTWGSNADFFFRLIGGDAKIYFYSSPFNLIVKSNVLTTNTWHHICVSRNSNITTFYVNGISGETSSTVYTVSNNKNELRLGLSHDNDEPLNGRMSNVRIYKGKGLTAAEVSQNYNATRGRYGI